MKRETIILEDQAQEALELSPYLMRKKLRCEANHGRVILRGEVDSYFQKQMATETLRKLSGVDEIDNRLEVTW